MKVVVTGAAGMIGSNIVQGLNAIGVDDVIAVDNLTNGPKGTATCWARKISDYFDKTDFGARFARREFKPRRRRCTRCPEATPCSTTGATCSTPTTAARRTCSTPAGTRAPAALRSSPATYGGSASFREGAAVQLPLNNYGGSMVCCCSQRGTVVHAAAWRRRRWRDSRYFNVYGPREQHKRAQLSTVAWPPLQPVPEGHGKVKLFGEYGFPRRWSEYHASRSRDFVFVDDVVA